MKRTIAVLLMLAMAVGLFAACESQTPGADLIGISMPTQSSERWIKDGHTMRDILIERGFNVDLQYAEDNIPTQRLQIEAMIARGAKVLVIAAVDASTLSSLLDEAAEQGVKVISYDRLLVDTAAVSYYATFDNVSVGVLQAQSLIDGLKEHRGEGPWNIELFAGSPDDTNSFFFFSGAMQVLQPYIDAGQVTVVSGQMTQGEVGTLRWDGAVAQARMDAILAAHYSGGTPLHGVLSPYDGLSRGIISALISFGFEVGTDNWPVVTGQDAEAASITMIRSGHQYSTVLKDTRDLARVAADMVEAVLAGTEPEINDTETYFNNVIFVPSYLLVPYNVDITNYRELVMDSGYLTDDDIQ